MVEPGNLIVGKMLERLFASMVSGPSMNCRPHASRQRIDLSQFSRLRDLEPGAALSAMLGPEGLVKVVARVPMPAKGLGVGAKKPILQDVPDPDDKLTPEERAARQAWTEQQSLLTKLRVIADDARTYEQDTGVHALNIGFPLLSLPPGTFGGRAGVASRRILAPIAFIPATLTVKTGTRQMVELHCHGDGVDLVVPNIALLAWLEQQTGQPMTNPFEDEAADDPWREIAELVRLVASRVDVAVPELFQRNDHPSELTISAIPRSDDDATGSTIVMGAVLGLFPTSNQGLLKDTREMSASGAEDGPIESFIRMDVSLETGSTAEVAATAAPAAKPAPTRLQRRFADERLVTLADPCQTQAVRLARRCRGLVIHGPPGTGKSQTIANVIGDHLARGERVLFVCDKRTALDVVADRLQALGLGDLCATIHDPQRDQRELYRTVREQLDNLADTAVKAQAAAKLEKVDAELQLLHDDLTRYHQDLMTGADGESGGPGSFHHLVGQWLSETGEVGDVIDWRSLQGVSAGEYERHKQRLKEVLERGEATAYAKNPWRPACGLDLGQFLANPMDVYRQAVARCIAAARDADATVDPILPPFTASGDLAADASEFVGWAEKLEQIATVSPTYAKHWASQPLEVVQRANSEMASLGSAIDFIRGGQWDQQLRDRCPTDVPTERLSSEQQALATYVSAYDLRVATYERVRSAVPVASSDVIFKWMTADRKASASARKRLDAASSIAASVEGSTLDPSLLARFDAAPFDSGKIVEALAALNAYLDIAGKWTAVFQLAKKKAADPLVRHFGLSLNPGSAASLKKFLMDLQDRANLRAAIEAVRGEPFDERPDDTELLDVYREHQGVLTALSTPAENAPALTTATGATATAMLADDDLVAAINRGLGALAEVVLPIMQRYQLAPQGENARRLVDHLRQLEARSRVCEWLGRLLPSSTTTVDNAADHILADVQQAQVLLGHLTIVPRGTQLGDVLIKAIADRDVLASTVAALRRAPVRSAALLTFERTLASATMFDDAFLKSASVTARTGRSTEEMISPLVEHLDTLEGVIRVRDGLAQLPQELSKAAAALLDASSLAAVGYSAVRRNVIAGEISRRLKASPHLQQVDGVRLRSAFDRFRQLSETKKELVRDLIQHVWVSRQKERLLAGTGTRLNSVGADLRRRLTLRGERAMRLRQVIAHGRGLDGGDPLFDLRPIWMASPETVAQLFPREATFDVVVFDEASQCRLEEALPVLTRAKRVVIAGDPKQLPPTRFFESAVTASEHAEAESDQELFEAHQGEIEDLLTASLGLDVQQSYLDVHYRSRNADLIGFSNEHFYGSRLQAIPGHPRNRSRFAPLTLYRADGVYEKRQNVIEAEAVCNIVRDLLKRAAPPSIGITCFNLVQRDLIVETLEEMAEEDPEFANRLAEARERRGANSSEGLFVKNLENVQGDERDHIIISTTYGPDPNGKFRRSFGPLGSAGGGRRLNVLVTRARDELHIVTSIPKSAYAALPDVPSGTTPSGAWLLFAYLQYAEQLQQEYEENHRILQAAGPAERASVNPRPSRTPSTFAKALASRIAATHNHGSDVHWGNDGFCVDLAMHHPTRADDVTVGVLCDMTRFTGSEDPVEWDVFRTAVHEVQGWKLHRVWTPHFFRDPSGSMSQVAAAVDAKLATDVEQR